MRVDAWGFLYLSLLGLLVPILAVKSNAALNAGMPFPSRKSLFLQTLFTLTSLLLVTLAVARTNSVTLFHPIQIRPIDLAAGGTMLAIALGSIPVRWRFTSPAQRDRLYAMVPHHRGELLPWMVLSLVAGVSEEAAYRGMFFILFERLSHWTWLSLALSIAAFAVGHMVQGLKSVIMIALFAAGFHLLVWICGTLYIAMSVHVLYDLFAGVIYGRLGARIESAPLDP
jgi:hypothetical protein